MKACEALLKNSDSNKRLVAYRALRRLDTNMLPYAKQLMNDESPAVRRDVALSLRNLSADDTKEIFIALASDKNCDPSDKNYIEAIGLGAANKEQAIWSALHNSLTDKNPDNWSEAFAKVTWRLWSPDAIPALKQRAMNAKLTSAQREFAVETIAFINHPTAVDALFEIASKTDNELKRITSTWLFKNGAGEWSAMNIKKRLAETKIYDPETIVVNSITVEEDKPSDANSKERITRVLALKGDAKVGEKTIMRCTMCHEVNGQGPQYGPPLKGWGQTQSLEAIATSIIMPSADIAHGFRGDQITLHDGKIVHGLVQQGDPHIVSSTGGVVQLIPASKVKQIDRMPRSLMLSAGQLNLTDQEIADIIAYMKAWGLDK
jgi:putative heme-binding domain-containing protein